MIGNFGAGAARGRQAPPESGHLPETRTSKPRQAPGRRGPPALAGGCSTGDFHEMRCRGMDRAQRLVQLRCGALWTCGGRVAGASPLHRRRSCLRRWAVSPVCQCSYEGRACHSAYGRAARRGVPHQPPKNLALLSGHYPGANALEIGAERLGFILRPRALKRPRNPYATLQNQQGSWFESRLWQFSIWPSG